MDFLMELSDWAYKNIHTIDKSTLTHRERTHYFDCLVAKIEYEKEHPLPKPEEPSYNDFLVFLAALQPCHSDTTPDWLVEYKISLHLSSDATVFVDNAYLPYQHYYSFFRQYRKIQSDHILILINSFDSDFFKDEHKNIKGVCQQC